MCKSYVEKPQPDNEEIQAEQRTSDSSQNKDSIAVVEEQPTEEIHSTDESVSDETSSSSEETEIETTSESQPSEEISPSSKDNFADTPGVIEHSQETDYTPYIDSAEVDIEAATP